jgi:hypothetical protein
MRKDAELDFRMLATRQLWVEKLFHLVRFLRRHESIGR